MTMEREEAKRRRQGEMDRLDRRARARVIEASLCEKFAALVKRDDCGATSLSNTGLPR